MNKFGKIIVGVIVVAAVVGGGYFALNKKGVTLTNTKFGGQEVVLTNADKTVKLDLPKVDQLEDSEAAVMGFVNLTEEQEAQKQDQEEKRMQAMENGEEYTEDPESEISDTIVGKNYDILKDQSINQVSINLNNGVNAKYEISNAVYTKDVLESISKGVKESEFNGNTFMYTVLSQSEYNYYYMVCNKLESNSIFVILTSSNKLSEKDLVDYMSAIKF